MLVSRIALEAGRSVAIYSLPKLLARIRRTFDAETGEQSYSDLFERLATVDLLHIDDLGAENRTEWVLEQLYALVNERYEAQRALVVTTNLEEHELEDQIGERVVSRLVEMCGVRCRSSTRTDECTSRRTSPPRSAKAVDQASGRSITSSIRSRPAPPWRSPPASPC